MADKEMDMEEGFSEEESGWMRGDWFYVEEDRFAKWVRYAFCGYILPCGFRVSFHGLFMVVLVC